MKRFQSLMFAVCTRFLPLLGELAFSSYFDSFIYDLRTLHRSEDVVSFLYCINECNLFVMLMNDAVTDSIVFRSDGREIPQTAYSRQRE